KGYGAAKVYLQVELSPQRRCAPLLRNKEQLRIATGWCFRSTRLARPPRHGHRFFSSLLIMTSVALCACLSVTAAEQESREKYEGRFLLERDPMVKATILAKDGRYVTAPE